MNKIEFLIFIATILVFIILVGEAIYQTGFSLIVNFEKATLLGNTLSGILSFISVVLIYFSLQRQNDQFYINQFESKYFEQIKIHRENVQNLQYESPESKDEKNPEIKNNHQVFVSIYREIIMAIDYLDGLFSSIKIDDVYKSNEGKNESIDRLALSNRKIDLLVLEKINVAFLVVFYGVSQEGRPALTKRLREKYKDEFISEVIRIFTRIPVCWSQHRKKFDKGQSIYDTENFVKYFGGHQHRLGHYYRHLYQSLRYINDQAALSYNQKYGYAKMLRAQLSTYEQVVLFFNSLSDLGRSWELNYEDINLQLITKYNFIKNIPAGFIAGINVADYYPMICYEGLQRPSGRDELEKRYI